MSNVAVDELPKAVGDGEITPARFEIYRVTGDVHVLHEHGDHGRIIRGTMARQHRDEHLFLLTEMVDHVAAPKSQEFIGGGCQVIVPGTSKPLPLL
jgi:hypothetical protein